MTKNFGKLSGIFLISLLVLMPGKSFADHNAGGELTWECGTVSPNVGKYRFTLKLYRFCEGILLGTSAFVTSNSSVTGITLSRQGSPIDISPQCYDSTKQMNCYGTNSAHTIEESIYLSGWITITGVPPSTGWEFYWSSCCRPAPAIYNWGYIIDNLEPQNQSYRIKAYMFPYNGQNANPCYDNSPRFSERPATIICTGYPFTYNHNAVDVDLDSLTYIWGPPLQSSGASVTYATHTNTSQTAPRANGGNFIVPSPGFSSTVPLPWAHSNMNVNNIPASINLFSGEISFTSFTGGDYATAVIVSSYRCGVKIAEIMRDIPVNLLSCPPTPTLPPLSNTPPQVVFKWSPSSITPMPLPAGDTVWAGDSVIFYITSTDIQFLPGFVGQTNYLYPSGSQFGTGFSSTTSGCLRPPCATMDVTSSYFKPLKSRWEGQFGLAASFGWKTDCNHLSFVDSCFTMSNKYNFVFKILDNWCPAPGANFQTFTVTVLAPPAIPAPSLKCTRVLANGNVLLSWDQPVSLADDSLSSFRKYIIYRADSVDGVYDTLHIVQNIDSLTYLDVTANGLGSSKYYFIQGISSCNDQSVRTWSDTISSMLLNSQTYNSGGGVALNWNDFNPDNNFGATTTGQYYVWQVYNGDTLLANTTTESWDSLEIFLCYPSNVTYFITVEDTTLNFGCTSISSTVTAVVGDVTPPPAIVMDSMSYNTSNDIEFGWPSISVDVDKYFIYKGTQLIDSLPASQTSYQYNPLSADSCVLSFSVKSRDTCGNVSAAGIPQNTICLKIDNIIRCDTNKMIVIKWNIYNPAWSGVAAYQYVYRSTNSGPFVLLDSVTPLDNQYSDTSIFGNNLYAYRIRSWETGHSRGAWSSTASYNLGPLITGTIVPEPDLRCVSWLNDNTVRIEWVRPLNPDSNFHKYVIYHSPTGNPGSFTVLDSIRGVFTSDNLAWDSAGYTHNSASPTTAHFYYVLSSSGCDGLQQSIVSRTLRTIDLIVTPISDSVNHFAWNSISTTQMGNNYNFLKNGAVHAVHPYGTDTDEDTWVVCHDTAIYRIEFLDAGAYCVSRSKEIAAVYEDDTPPSKQFIDSVSMVQDSSFTPMIGWSQNPSSDVSGFLVLNCTGGNITILDTLTSTATFFADSANAPVTGIVEYSVTAMDSCGNNNLSTGNFDCHNNIDVRPSIDLCNKNISVVWNAYDDFNSGSAPLYKVFLSVDGGPFSLHSSSTSTATTILEPVEDSYYCLYVQAWDSNGLGPNSSSSAVKCIRYKGIKSPDYSYLKYVTVSDSNIIRLCMNIDITADIGEYWIRRSADPNAIFEYIETVVVPDPLTQADSNFCYEDAMVETDKTSYYYFIDVTDPCGNVTSTSNTSRSILLDVHTDTEKNWNMLTWNTYKEWFGSVMEYKIYRRTGKASFKLEETLNVNTMASHPEVSIKGEKITYKDDVSKTLSDGNGQFCYLVAAVEGPNTFHGLPAEVSKSNIVCAQQKPQIYSPNTFTPNGDGLNDKFLPAMAFHDLKAFNMQIYNRWGERIYETDDSIDGGWDGTSRGKVAPDGAYVYKVRYKSSDGRDFEEEGTVTLQR